jgi:demethylmenaquinone methyltransferase/2-methoxy-6-polyprenyl-1,4-benzoquinol methylase
LDNERIGTEDWSELQRNLEASIPVYDRINRWASLGQDQRWRKGIRALIQPNSSVLEIGCGPGTFAERVEGCEVTCLDPIPAMLKVAKLRVDAARKARGESPASFVEGTAESIPLPDGEFDVVCCLFSFRDFNDKRKSLEEILRVLKPGGRLLICDAGKANFVHGWLGWLWMKVWIGSYARMVCKQKEHPWKWLTKTYVHFGTTRFYKRMMRDVGFTKVEGRLLFPGMACRFIAKKSE